MEAKQIIIPVTRLETFIDAVIAIIITLMILSIEVPSFDPSDTSAAVWQKLSGMLQPAASYGLSFIIVGVLWVNHHQFLRQIKQADRKLLWFNLHLLFWLSLVPIPTNLLGHSIQRPEFTALYGFILLMCLLAFLLMRLYVERADLFIENISPRLKKQSRTKLQVCAGLYLISIFAGYISVYFSLVIFIGIAIAYFFPPKIEVQQ